MISPLSSSADTTIPHDRRDALPVISGNQCSEGTLFDIFCLLYVDDGAFAFQSRKELELGSAVVRRQFSRFGLEMHVGNKDKASKTEAVFFPPPGFFKLPSIPPSETSAAALPLATKPKQEHESKK